ncbi:hypothetical protein MP228_004971 [Amoeboaphelidium protococcarum]|nr:hypothetical protein MP228_004971 [Amoeboaphelidium protococcarum]
MPKRVYDVVVVGGGIVGSAFASGLAVQARKLGVKCPSIALIESAPREKLFAFSQSSPVSNRVSSLTPQSIDFLKECGVYQHVIHERVKAYTSMKVWDNAASDSPMLTGLSALTGMEVGGAIEFSSSDMNQSYIGAMIENNNLIQALFKNIECSNDVDLLYGQSVDKVIIPPTFDEYTDEAAGSVMSDGSELPRVLLKGDDSEIHCKLLVGADGANSVVRSASGVRMDGWDYGQSGVVASLNLDYDVSTAYQKFMPNNVMAILPLSESRASLVWSCPSQLARKLVSLPDGQFVELINLALQVPYSEIAHMLDSICGDGQDLLNQEDIKFANERCQSRYLTNNQLKFRDGLPRVTDIEPKSRAAFPLRFRKSEEYTRHRLALIGDAAHVIHPMAGLGLNLGLNDAQQLVLNCAQQIQLGQDLGSEIALARYQRTQNVSNLATMASIDMLWRLYGVTDNDSYGLAKDLVTSVRVLGMDLFNSSRLIKSTAMKYAMSV